MMGHVLDNGYIAVKTKVSSFVDIILWCMLGRWKDNQYRSKSNEVISETNIYRQNQMNNVTKSDS